MLWRVGTLGSCVKGIMAGRQDVRMFVRAAVKMACTFAFDYLKENTDKISCKDEKEMELHQ